MIVAFPWFFTVLGRRVQNIASKVRWYVIIANDCTNKSENDATIRIRIESFLKNSHCRLNKLFLKILSFFLYLKQFIHGIYEWKFQILWICCRHQRLRSFFYNTPEINHFLRSEVIYVLWGFVKSQHMVSSKKNASKYIGVDKCSLLNEYIRSNELHLF